MKKTIANTLRTGAKFIYVVSMCLDDMAEILDPQMSKLLDQIRVAMTRSQVVPVGKKEEQN